MCVISRNIKKYIWKIERGIIRQIIFKEENGNLFGSTNIIGIGKRKPNLIYGEQAKKLREKADLTIEELAKELKINEFDLQRLEEQKQTLTDKVYEKYKKKFNVEKEYFFDLDLETLILSGEGHVLKSFETSEDCKFEYNRIMNEYFEALKNNETIFILDFERMERGNG